MKSFQAEELSISPLSPNGAVEQLPSLESASIEARWKSEFGMEISKFWHVPPQLNCFRCLDSDLVFFQPDGAAGNGEFYEQLQKFDWYYMPIKWEHDQALMDIEANSRVLEVGCGAGAFVERLKSKGHLSSGLELNESAAKQAHANGLDVTTTPLSEYGSQIEQEFDVVCHFEVLEHVVQIKQFLEDCLNVLRPGGRLLLALPNMDSFLKHAPTALLNQPPHHMSQWKPATVRYLEKCLPLKLERMAFEPLATYHIDYYTDIRWNQIMSWVPRGHRFLRMGRTLLRAVVANPALRKLITGHTQYACFRKLNGPTFSKSI